ncbi:MAG TPA: ABC transporter permease [Thermoanaerobaculia bacterium]
MATFVYAFRSEWLKRKRSSASLMLLGGSLFTPAIVATVRLLNYRTLPAIYAGDAFWKNLWSASWESMAVFFLPMTAILATSLVTQIEYRGNAWKQVHALPMSSALLFLAKLAVILVMMVQFLVLFCAGIYVSGMTPSLLVPGVPAPKGSFFDLPLLRDSALYFVDCLPIVAAQYAMGLRANNVLVPIGAGFLAWVGALAAVSSRFAIWWPYAYTTINYIKDTPKGAAFAAHTELHALALGFFVLLTLAGYVSFITKPEKG